MRAALLCTGLAALAAVASPARAQAPTPVCAPPSAVAADARQPDAPACGAWTSVILPGAQQLDLRARANGQRYRLFVAVPPGARPAAGYPVLYVLDGNASFPLAAFLARSAAARAEIVGGVAPLVVGIGYPGDADYDVAARRRDYTTAYTDGAAATADESGADAGGAAAFLDVIEHEVKPLIAARHRVDAARQALFGHSFGGLFVLHALFTRPQVFSTYIASSPSIWWRGRQVLTGLRAWQREAPARLPRVQISVGALEDEPPPEPMPPAMRALRASRPMVAPARALAAELRALPGARARVAYHELAGEDHGTAWLSALARGLHFFLEPEAASAPNPTSP